MLTRYNESTSTTVQAARKQSEGDKTTAVNFFDMESTYQDNFTTKTATPGDTPAGNFTDDALEHYDQEVTELASNHEANASNIQTHYVTKHSNAAGIVYQSTISEK